ncbi:MAG TPA: hypothetical protein VKB54_11135 [Solirubrobacteraceae bacterium]|nr:hypothetical protein [Solirubrobacteraceae bacterium]
MSSEAFAALRPETCIDPRTLTRDVARASVPIDLSSCVPARLSVRTAGPGRLVIPPLGTVRVDAAAVDLEQLRVAQDAGVLAVSSVKPTPMGVGAVWAMLCAAVVVLATAIGLAVTVTDIGAVPLVAGVIVALILTGCAVWAVPALAPLKEACLQLPARLREALVFGLAAMIVFALPGAILYFGSNVPHLWHEAQRDHDYAVALIGVGVKFVCVVGASALPVLLYFIFDRERMLTLRQRVTRNIFRLDPRVRTLREIDAKYGQWLDEAFGREPSETRFLPGTRWPILVATAVLTLGWAIALLDTDAADPHKHVELASLIAPAPSAATFAFLGAYFFTLNSTLRGFVRGDLRPKTYAQIATRIVGSVVLAFTIERLLRGVGMEQTSASLLLFAFLAGVVPETVLIRLQEASRGFVRGRAARRQIDHASRTYEPEPLTRLQGIDIYDRARLLDEGVTNVEGLAHHDVVELLLKTRIPATRLVDWVDQAILFIHCTDGENGAGSSAYHHLRVHGIRTATDLRRAYAEAKDKDAFLRIVPSPQGTPPVLTVILDAIEEENWIDNLTHWNAKPAQVTIKVPEGLAAG